MHFLVKMNSNVDIETKHIVLMCIVSLLRLGYNLTKNETFKYINSSFQYCLAHL